MIQEELCVGNKEDEDDHGSAFFTRPLPLSLICAGVPVG